jgi:phosphoglycerate dehydrogenase-like enzyme
MRIVVLDDIGIGAEDLRRLEQKGDVRVFSGSPHGLDEVVERARGAEVVISGWTKIDGRVLAALPGLQLVSLWATGLDNVDLAAAHAHDVVVSHVPSYAANAVAELALGLMLAVLRKIPAADQHLRRSGRPEWQPFQGGELHGKRLGVVGTGVIGQRVARVGRCLGMSLLGYDLQPSQAMIDELGMRYLTLSQLFADSDVVTLHAPLTPDTQDLVDGALLRRLPETAVVINTARAGLISQDDLLEVLRAKAIAGAGLDVIDLSLESGAGLLALDNVVATPHIGFYTREALANLTEVCVDNVVGFLEGAPVNVAALPPAPAEPQRAGAGAPNEEENSGI